MDYGLWTLPVGDASEALVWLDLRRPEHWGSNVRAPYSAARALFCSEDGSAGVTMAWSRRILYGLQASVRGVGHYPGVRSAAGTGALRIVV